MADRKKRIVAYLRKRHQGKKELSAKEVADELLIGINKVYYDRKHGHLKSYSITDIAAYLEKEEEKEKRWR